MDQAELKKELKKSYAKGYRIGKKWDRDWRPGGPHAVCANSRKVRDEWLRGWESGFSKRKI